MAKLNGYIALDLQKTISMRASPKSVHLSNEFLCGYGSSSQEAHCDEFSSDLEVSNQYLHLS